MVAAPVSEERLRDLATLLTRELGETLPVGPDVAADMARAIVTAALAAAAHHADAVPSDAGMPGKDARAFLRAAATDAIVCARATRALPEGSGWWRGAGSEALVKLSRGDAQSAFIDMAEHLAGPYDVPVDFNWGAGSRLARSAPEIPVGSTFLAGDGEGNRAVVEIVEVDGERSGRVDLTTWVNPTDRYLVEASPAVARSSDGRRSQTGPNETAPGMSAPGEMDFEAAPSWTVLGCL